VVDRNTLKSSKRNFDKVDIGFPPIIDQVLLDPPTNWKKSYDCFVYHKNHPWVRPFRCVICLIVVSMMSQLGLA
jgi:hypothetical protein